MKGTTKSIIVATAGAVAAAAYLVPTLLGHDARPTQVRVVDTAENAGLVGIVDSFGESAPTTDQLPLADYTSVEAVRALNALRGGYQV